MRVRLRTVLAPAAAFHPAGHEAAGLARAFAEVYIIIYAIIICIGMLGLGLSYIHNILNINMY